MKKNIIKSLLAIACLLCSIGVYAHDFKANVLCNDLVNRMQTSRKEGAQSNLPKTSQFLPGIYAAYAESAFSGYPDEAWTVSITQDAYDGDKVWIQPIIAPFGGLDADEISPVYAYVDEENCTLRLPLGQTLYGEPREYYNIVVASLDNNYQPVISGEIVVPYYISDDNLTFTIDFLGAGDLNDEAGWWYQALLSIKFSSWTDNAIDGFYYTITSEDECTVAVTYAGEDYRSFKNEYSGSIVIPEKVIINEKSYSVTSIGEFAFADCIGLTEVTIPNSVTSIGNGAFYWCTGLTEVTIPNSVASIGSLAFADCTGLTSIVVDKDNQAYDSRDNCNAIIETATNTLITGCKNSFIPNSVTSIGDYAFYYCTGLTEITIPNSITSIGDWAFYYCTGLTEIHSNAFMPPFDGDRAFEGIDSSIPVYVPTGSVQLYESAWIWFTNIIEEPGSSVAPKYLGREYIAEATNALDGTDVNYYVSITIDDDVPNRIWIHPVLQPFGGLNSSDILPVYAYVDALSNSIVMPLGQTLFGGNGESFNILLGTFNENDGNINTHGVTIATYSIEDEVLNIAWNDLLVAYDNGLYQALMNIIFTTEVTGVENVSCDISDAPTEYYDLSGRCIENPTRGIYILKQGNTVKKVVL